MSGTIELDSTGVHLWGSFLIPDVTDAIERTLQHVIRVARNWGQTPRGELGIWSESDGDAVRVMWVLRRREVPMPPDHYIF